MGPGELPPVRALVEACRHLELAVLNALAHASARVEIGKPIVSLAIEACRKRSGEARGEAWGKLEGARQAIRQAMKVRKMRLTVAADKRIDRETDLRTLRRWLSRAITMDKTSEIFE